MPNKIMVQKANKVLEIPEDRLQEFIEKGYNQIDDMGNIIKEAIPTDIGMLRIKFLEHTRLISKYETEIAQLKNQLAKSKKTQTE